MSGQDAIIHLVYIDRSNHQTKGILKMQHNNGNVSLSFFPETQNQQNQRKNAQIPNLIFQLGDFTMIEINPDNPNVISLAGTRNKCTLNFDSENDSNKFFDYINQKLHLRHSCSNANVYILENLDPSTNPPSKFMPTILPKPQQASNISPTQVILKNLVKSGFIFSDQKDPPQPQTFTADDFKTYLDENGAVKDIEDLNKHLFNATVDLSIQGSIWKLYLFKKDKPAYLLDKAARDEIEAEYHNVYSLVKSQWRTITQRQWDNDTELQKLVLLIESDIKKNSSLFSSFTNPQSIMKFAFNILLTVSIYNNDEASYIPKMVQFLVPFLSSFILDAHYGGEETATMVTNEVIPIDKAEADVFWCFYNFYIDNEIFKLMPNSKLCNLKSLFVEAGKLISGQFQPLLQLLYQKYVTSLDFLTEDLIWWFSDIFNVEELKRLWLSILVDGPWNTFYQCFICSILYSITPQLGQMYPLQTEDFLIRFDEIKKHFDLNILLSNTKALYEIIKPKKPVETPPPQQQPTKTVSEEPDQPNENPQTTSQESNPTNTEVSQ